MLVSQDGYYTLAKYYLHSDFVMLNETDILLFFFHLQYILSETSKISLHYISIFNLLLKNHLLSATSRDEIGCNFSQLIRYVSHFLMRRCFRKNHCNCSVCDVASVSIG